MAPTMSGRVTKGPMPTMSMTLRPSAEPVESPRCRPVAGGGSAFDREMLSGFERGLLGEI